MPTDLTPFKLTSALVIICAFFAGCSSVEEIRTHHTASVEAQAPVDALNPKKNLLRQSIRSNDPAFDFKDCVRSAATPDDRAYSIEDYGDFWAGFAEFDDQGWKYQSKELSQIDAIRTKLKSDLADPRYAAMDFEVIAFVHGWHHNAHYNDCNVHEFRSMLKLANERFKSAKLKRERRVIGIYVGWRGESLNLQGLNVTTFFDRSNAADRVAKGDVRGLFAVIKKAQSVVETEHRKGNLRTMRTVVIGHSFGGLIAFHGLAPAILGDLTLAKVDAEDCRQSVADPVSNAPAAANRSKNTFAAPPIQDSTSPIDSFPNMLVLINPAFEGTRFQAMHELDRPVGCKFPDIPPKVVVVTAENDQATKTAFVAERKLITILEKYPEKPVPKSGVRDLDERESNSHAIGFIDRYRTHELCLVQTEDKKSYWAAAYPYKPPETKEATDREVMDWSDPDEHPAVWVVRAPQEIVDGHDGFLYASKLPDNNTQTPTQGQAPYLLNWLLSLDTQTSWASKNTPALLSASSAHALCKISPKDSN